MFTESRFADDALSHGALVGNLEVKFDATKAGSFTGYASVFNNVDSYGDIMRGGAFAESIKTRRQVPLLFNHRMDNLLGKAVNLTEDDIGLRFDGRMTAGVQLADDTLRHIKAGALDGASIGYRIQPGGAKLDGELREITRVDLVEISMVIAPANKLARVDPASLKSVTSVRQLESILRDAGLSREDARTFISSLKKSLDSDPWDAENGDALLGALRQPARVRPPHLS